MSAAMTMTAPAALPPMGYAAPPEPDAVARTSNEPLPRYRLRLHGKDKIYEGDELYRLRKQMRDAYWRGDMDEYRRIGHLIPAKPKVAKAFAAICGKEWLLSGDFDLTECEHQYGKDWLNHL